MVPMKINLIAIAALSQRLTLLPTSSDPWQRRRNKLRQLSEAIKASNPVIKEVISQATLRPLNHLFSSRSLVMNLRALIGRTAKLERLDSITSQSSLRVPLRIRSKSAQALALVLVVLGRLKPPNPQIMVSSIQTRTSPPNPFLETISSPQLRPLGQEMVGLELIKVFAGLKTETASLLATSRSNTQKMALMRSPSATRSSTLAPVSLEVHLWLLKEEAGILVPLRTRNKSLILKITRAIWTTFLTTASRTSTTMMTSCEEQDNFALKSSYIA